MAEVMPPPSLDGIELPAELILRLPLFRELRTPPNLARFPSFVRLRRFRKGDVICHQGDEGNEAFFIPSYRDLEELCAYPESRLAAARAELEAVQTQLRQTGALTAKQVQELEKKQATLTEEIDKLPSWQEVVSRIDIPPDQRERLQAARRADEALRRRLRELEARDPQQAQALGAIFRAAPARKHDHAGAIQGQDPQLADWLRDLARGEKREVVATVHLAFPKPAGPPADSWWQRVKDAFRGTGPGERPRQPAYIPNDGPRDVRYDSQETVLKEGELFGEMSCLYRTRRSATVVAAQDCYLLEIVRNILDMMRKDPTYRARMDEEYRKRVLDLHLRALPMFASLDDEMLARIRVGAELIDCAAGTLICDEHDQSDSMYLIRSGIVKVVKNVSCLIEPAQVADWNALARELRPGAQEAAGARRSVWEMLPNTVREMLATGDGAPWTADRQAAVVAALNAVVKDTRLHEAAEGGTHLHGSGMAREVWRLLADPRKAAESERHRANRLVLESLYTNLGPALKPQDEPETSPLLRVDDVANWKALGTALAWEDRKDNDWRRQARQRLAPVQPLLQAAESGESLGPEQRRQVVEALNGLIGGALLVPAAELAGFARVQPPAVARYVGGLPSDPKTWSAAEQGHCNRLLLMALFPNAQIPHADLASAADDAFLLRADDIVSWKDLGTGLLIDGDARRRVWTLLPQAVRDLLRAAKSGKEPDPVQRAQVVEAVNDLLRGEFLLLFADFQPLLATDANFAKKVQAKIQGFLTRQKKWTEHDYRRYNRALNRLLLESVCPRGLAKLRDAAGLATILAYRARGESIGEMGLMEGKPRSASCVAYNHPESDPDREVGPVQLVRIDRGLFEALKERSPEFGRQILEVIQARRRDASALQSPAAPVKGMSLLLDPRAEDLGLIEGQRLMLIDLDRCTRCDECVRACVDTHADGRSRLFLDGPRFHQYLVPMTCRSCLDPVCMIGCPVGSIHRGDNGQIRIENWCIGCGHCAEQCPYGSIQMHDIGLVPKAARGWRYLPASAVPEDGWQLPAYRDGHWAQGTAPFQDDREFRYSLREYLAARHLPGDAGQERRFYFRYEFVLPRDRSGPDAHFELEITSPKPAETPVWVNGRQLRTTEKERQGKLRYFFPQEPTPATATAPAGEPARLSAGRNVIAVDVTLDAAAEPQHGAVLLALRVDEARALPLPTGGTRDIKLVAELAVVCDLCSGLPGQVPACVNACPHDAAMRFDARGGVPGR